MTPDDDGIPIYTLDDLGLPNPNHPVTAGEILPIINALVRAIARNARYAEHLSVGQVIGIDPGPPRTLIIQSLRDSSTQLTGVRFQQGLGPTVGDYVFVLTEASFSYVTGKVAG